MELIATTRERRPWSRPPLSMSFQVGGGAYVGGGGCCCVWAHRRRMRGWVVGGAWRRGPLPDRAAPRRRRAQVPMHSASGVKVQYLKVWEKVG